MRREQKRKERKSPTITNPKQLTYIISAYISLITLNVNGLNALTKRHRQAEWIQTKICIYSAYKRPTSDLRTHTDLKLGDGRNYSMQIEIKRKLE